MKNFAQLLLSMLLLGQGAGALFVTQRDDSIRELCRLQIVVPVHFPTDEQKADFRIS